MNKNEKNQERKEQQAKAMEALSKNNGIVNQKAIALIQSIKQGATESDIVNQSYTLCIILLHSKLKALNSNEKTYNANNVRLKNGITALNDKDTQRLKSLQYMEALDDLYVTTYNKSGDLQYNCLDNDNAKEIEHKLYDLSQFNDSMDIIQHTVLKLFKILDGVNDTTPDTYLLDPFETYISSSKVYRNGNIKPIEFWRTTTTNHIREISKEISRYIEAQRAIRENEKAYDEIETTIRDPYTGAEEVITRYVNVPTCCINENTDFNGKPTTQTADKSMTELIGKVITECNFNPKQVYIFKHYFLFKKSALEIAHALNTTDNNINVNIHNIRKEIVKSGIFKNYGISDLNSISNEEKSKKIIAYDPEGVEIGIFDSIGKAASILQLDKGGISRVLKGSQKSVKGYTFKELR